MTSPEGLSIGMGLDSHGLEPGGPLILGGITIPFEKSLVGHCFKPIYNPIVDVNGFVELDHTSA